MSGRHELRERVQEGSRRFVDVPGEDNSNGFARKRLAVCPTQTLDSPC